LPNINLAYPRSTGEKTDPEWRSRRNEKEQLYTYSIRGEWPPEAKKQQPRQRTPLFLPVSAVFGPMAVLMGQKMTVGYGGIGLPCGRVFNA
jgi:hypothetical protein